MSKINDIINQEIHKFEEILLLGSQINATDRSIAMHLLSIWKKRQKIKGITELANKLAMAPSNISKFLNKYNLQKYSVIKFIFEVNSKIELRKDNLEVEKDIFNASLKIKSANRIIIVGTGNSGLIGKSFYTRLVLRGYHAIFVEGKPDQLRLIERSSTKDIIVCFSFSFSHQWVKKLWESNRNSIFFTGQSMNSSGNRVVFSSSHLENIKYHQEPASSIATTYENIDKIMTELKKGQSF